MAAIQPLPEEDRLLAPAEAAAVLGVEVRTVTRWAETGKIPVVRTPGGHRRYRPADVEELRQERARKASAA